MVATLRNLAQRKENLFGDLDRRDPHLHLLELDVTREDNIVQARQWFESQNFGLDCLVNNAGFGLFGAVEDLTLGELRAQFEVNFFGLVRTTQEFLPLLRERRGRIINASSTLGFTGMPLSASYTSTKFAVEGWSECLALDLAPHHVKVSLIEPGAFKTSFSDNLRWAKKSELASSLYFEQTQAFKKARQRYRRSPPAEAVVKKMVWTCETPRLPLRVRVGYDAALAYWARKILPQQFFFQLLKWVFSKMKA